MVQFDRLRVVGFKSFVESTDLAIENGMTGVVGPNGCGKSNLVEALKWVMGETSAKQMRGADMDDVIFGGSQGRPARNMAEVAVVLDNRSRTAPAMFNDADELEVSRRIERGQGSLYKVNGREVRARDVALLFADAATGARSTALVSQGRIGAIINAKPADRRSLLEEAAGIAGLHSRRHEAEIRLRGAESNLARLEDVLVTLDAQLQALVKQAKQAARYRTISDQIRTVEARLLLRRWDEAVGALDLARDALAAIDSEVAERTGRAAQAATRQAEAASALPPLRQHEAEAAARLQRLRLAGEQLDAEEARIAQARRDLATRLAQTAADLEREAARAADAQEALARLAEEERQLRVASQGDAEAQALARETLSKAAQAVNEQESELARLTERVAAEAARKTALERRLAEIAERIARLEARQSEVATAIGRAEAEAAQDAEVVAAQTRLDAARQALEAARARLDEAERLRESADTTRAQARDALSAEEAAGSRLKAEADGLTALLAAGAKEGTPILDAITVDPGLETALGAALGEDLEAPVDPDQLHHWALLAPYTDPPALPEGVTPLAQHVRAPAELARRLSQIGLVEDGATLRAALKPGQRLVSRAGALWRWDGFTVAAGAPSPAATRLAQRNRLAEIALARTEAEGRIAQAQASLVSAQTAAESAQEGARLAREAQKGAEGEVAQAGQQHTSLLEKAAELAAKLGALKAQAEQAAADKNEAQTQHADTERALAEHPDPETGRAQMAGLRETLTGLRSALLEARAGHDRLMREAGERQRRLEAIGQELLSWTSRAESAQGQIAELEARQGAARAEDERLAALPAEIAAKRAGLLSEIGGADSARQEAADRLARAETEQAEADRALKEAEQALAQAREERVRRESALEAGKQLCRTVAERVAERLECTPETIAETCGLDPDEVLPPVEDLERRLERLGRERENIGPVNLRAEAEAEELTKQLDSLKAEREDLIAAIARLRQGIAELNREGRERLVASFEAVDRHFRELFVRLFGGGRAHLALTEAEDPLEAGLEIMASPPGKRLQVMSLLSGGEQAMTALALLFAVFMTNPAPICVLDEVDAPLDDANVDRFCTLLADMMQTTSTRFLVVTHHRMTMARMDRLYGVTMPERGVSKLVSVDLKTAETLRKKDS
ncbi:MAG: chromosome segregation protein SMC [Rhodospirillales bacterium]|nr:chromosome segregation protein SMC [Rhodospirillales bacterium]